MKLCSSFPALLALVFGSWQLTAQPSGDPVVIGAIYNLSGSQSGLDQPSSKGAILAIQQANSAGGVLGRPVQLVMENGASDPKVVEGQTRKILADHPGVAGFIGLSDTDMVLAAAPVAAAAKRVFLTSGATSPQLPTQVPDYLFLACFGDNVQAAAAAEWAFKVREMQTMAFLVDPGMSYTQNLGKMGVARFEELGGRAITAPPLAPANLNKPNFGSDQRWTLGMAFSGAELIYTAYGPDDILAIVKRIREDGIVEPLIGGDSLDIPEVWAANPEIMDLFFTTHAYLGEDSPDRAVVEFRKEYMAAHGEQPDAFAALGYDAARLMLQAIAAAKSTEGDAVKEALAKIENFTGVTGSISYKGGNRIPHKSVTLMEVSGGKLKFVRQITPEQVPAP